MEPVALGTIDLAICPISPLNTKRPYLQFPTHHFIISPISCDYSYHPLRSQSENKVPEKNADGMPGPLKGNAVNRRLSGLYVSGVQHACELKGSGQPEI